MSEVSSAYTIEKANESILKTYSEFVNERIELFKNEDLNTLKSTI